MAHPEKNLNAETERQAQEIFPFLESQLTGNEQIALDFGCGAGRFTARLAKTIRGSSIGVDPTKLLIEIAKTSSPENEFRLLENGQIPYPEKYFDVVFINLVLGGIPENGLQKTVVEIERVLKTDGKICMVENISNLPDAPHWFFRSADFYESLFPNYPLKLAKVFQDAGEQIGVFVSHSL